MNIKSATIYSKEVNQLLNESVRIAFIKDLFWSGVIRQKWSHWFKMDKLFFPEIES
jgi:hypothetical protein